MSYEEAYQQALVEFDYDTEAAADYVMRKGFKRSLFEETMREWDELVKSLQQFQQEPLEKARKRDISKLQAVQREVTRNGKTFIQTVYVAGDKPKAGQKTKKQEDPNKEKTKKQEDKATAASQKYGDNPVQVKDKEHLKQLRAEFGNEHIIEMAKRAGIKFKANENYAPHTYMRAAMAIDKHIREGGEFYINIKPHKFHVKVKSKDPSQTSYREVMGEPVPLGREDVKGMVHRNNDGTWTVFEKRTGLALTGKFGTKLEAIDNAKTRLKLYGDSIGDKIAKHPSSPGYKETPKQEEPKQEEAKKEPAKKTSGPSKELKTLAEKSTDGMEMFMNASEKPELMEELKEALKGVDGVNMREKLNKLFDQMDGGKGVSDYLPDSETKMDAFEPGKPKFEPSEVKVVARKDKRSVLASAPTGGDIEVHPDLFKQDEAAQKHVIAHEVGHVISNAFPELERHVLENPEGALGRTNKKAGRFEGVSYTPEESWAEAFATYHSDPDWLKQNHPKAYQFVDTVLKKIPSAKKYLEQAYKAYDEYKATTNKGSKVKKSLFPEGSSSLSWDFLED